MKTRLLWNSQAIPDSASHAVYVTGNEVDKTGKVLGYFINDTGTGEAARFIPRKDFLKAWSAWFVAFDD